jgi:hypothetical protein
MKLPPLGACRRSNFCAATGRSARFSCAARCPASAASPRARSSRDWPRAPTSSRAWCAGAARAGRWRTARSACPALRRNSTLLVSGVNLHLAAADRLLRAFDFLPQARLDDVMVSWAAPGGGVGPHFDSYDVFLVQGEGRRVWRLARRRAFRAVAGAPLRLIADFAPEEELLAEPGDLLYLPPGWGHDGVALDDCLTCSVGLRAPQGAGARRRVSRLPARARAAARRLPRPGPAAGAAPRGDPARMAAHAPRARAHPLDARRRRGRARPPSHGPQAARGLPAPPPRR